jgi:hypothetical protein
MDHLLAQHDLEAVLSSLVSLVPYLTGTSCEEGTQVLVKLLGEALEAQDAALSRAGELKKLNLKDLMDMFSPEVPKASKTRLRAIKPQLAPRPVEMVVEVEKKPIAKPAKPGKPSMRKPLTPREKSMRRKRVLDNNEAVDKAAAAAAAQQELVLEALEREKKAARRLSAETPQGGGGGGGGSKLRQGGTWSGVDFPRVTKIVQCEEADGVLRVQLYAKRAGRGEVS